MPSLESVTKAAISGEPSPSEGGRAAGNGLQGANGDAAASGAAESAAADPSFPRILLIDHALRGGPTAAGQLTGALLGAWPAAAIRQIWQPKPGVFLFSDTGEANSIDLATVDQAIGVVGAFAPDLVVYRPVAGASGFHALAMAVIGRAGKPFVTWTTQDWPAEAEAGEEALSALLADWRLLIAHAAVNFAAGKAMAAGFATRYRVPFLPVANAVDPADWPAPEPRAPGPFRLRHIGTIGARRNLDSLLRVARAVEKLAEDGRSIVLEISTRPQWHARFANHFAKLRHTRVEPGFLDPAAYRGWLRGADANLLCYNFDEASRRAVELPLANALPELLIAGRPLLVHGPQQSATVAYLGEVDGGLRVTEPGLLPLTEALMRLTGEPAFAAALGERGRATALVGHDLATARDALRAAFETASRTAPPAAAALERPMPAAPAAVEKPIAAAPAIAVPSYSSLIRSELDARPPRPSAAGGHSMVEISGRAGTSPSPRQFGSGLRTAVDVAGRRRLRSAAMPALQALRGQPGQAAPQEPGPEVEAVPAPAFPAVSAEAATPAAIWLLGLGAALAFAVLALVPLDRVPSVLLAALGVCGVAGAVAAGLRAQVSRALREQRSLVAAEMSREMAAREAARAEDRRRFEALSRASIDERQRRATDQRELDRHLADRFDTTRAVFEHSVEAGRREAETALNSAIGQLEAGTQQRAAALEARLLRSEDDAAQSQSRLGAELAALSRHLSEVAASAEAGRAASAARFKHLEEAAAGKADELDRWRQEAAGRERAFRDRFGEVERARAALEADLAKLAERAQATDGRFGEVERARAALEADLAKLAERAQASDGRFGEVERARLALESELAGVAERLQATDGRLGGLAAESEKAAEKTARQIAGLERAVADGVRALDTQDGRLAEVEGALAARIAEGEQIREAALIQLAGVEQRVGELNRLIADLDEANLGAAARATELERLVLQQGDGLTAAAARIAELERAAERLDRLDAQLAGDRAGTEERLAALTDELSRQVAAVGDLDGLRARLTEDGAFSARRAAEIEAALAEVASRADLVAAGVEREREAAIRARDELGLRLAELTDGLQSQSARMEELLRQQATMAEADEARSALLVRIAAIEQSARETAEAFAQHAGRANAAAVQLQERLGNTEQARELLLGQIGALSQTIGDHGAKLEVQSHRQSEIDELMRLQGEAAETARREMAQAIERLQAELAATDRTGALSEEAETLLQAKLAEADEARGGFARQLLEFDQLLAHVSRQVENQLARTRSIEARLAAGGDQDKALREVTEQQSRHFEGVFAEIAGKLEQQSVRTQQVERQVRIQAEKATSLEGTLREQREQLDSRIAAELSRLSDADAARSSSLADVATGLAAQRDRIEAFIEREKASQEEVGGSLGKFAEALATMEASLAQLTAMEEETRGRVAELAPQLDHLRSDVSDAKAARLADQESLRERLSTIRGELGTLYQRYGGLDEQANKLEATDEVLKEQLADLAERIAVMREGLDRAREEASAAAETASRTEERLDDSKVLGALENRSSFARFNRRFGAEHVKALQENWLRRLSVTASPAGLGYMAARICQLEIQMRGRLAATIEDAMLRAIVARAIKSETVEILEIGTLFGVGGAILHDAVRAGGRAAHLTLIDPLEGYYSRDSLDVVTQQPVNEDTLRANLTVAQIPPEDVTVVKALSTAPEALEAASQRSYDLLVIDGDHSFTGVAADFKLYGRLVKVGGYIIFDDYGQEDWPDVKRFVDEEMPKVDWCARVGDEWKTAVFRVVSPPPGVKPPAAAAARTAPARKKARSGTRASG